MGDMADFALDHAMDDWEHYERYKDAPMHVQYDEGLIDETGATICDPGSLFRDPVAVRERQISFAKSTNPVGPGACPKCGGETHIVRLKNGRYFFGCNDYPNCRGSRNGE